MAILIILCFTAVIVAAVVTMVAMVKVHERNNLKRTIAAYHARYTA